MILSPCIDRITLLMLEDGGLETGVADATRAHLAACDRCRALAAELATLSEAVGRFASARPVGSCPDGLVLASYAEGRLSSQERADCEAHMADCGRCTADLAALGRELAGLEVDANVTTPAWALARARALVGSSSESAAATSTAAAAAGARAPGQSPARSEVLTRIWARLRADSFPVAAAASLVLMVLLQLPQPGVRGPGVRGAQYDSPDDIVLTAPIGESLTDAGGVLSWDPVPGAGTYTVNVVDSAGNLVWTAESSAPRISIPADLRLTPGASYSWWVKTVIDSGEEIESPLGHFTVGQ